MVGSRFFINGSTLQLITKLKIIILDMCAAPGGKAFQMLSNNKVILNDISKKRILKL